MKVLVINCGSSSLKYQLFNMESEQVLAKGIVERIGLDNAFLKHQPAGKEEIKVMSDMPNHKVAIELVLKTLVDPNQGVIKDMSEISAVGHRIVHGGEKFSGSVLITDEVMEGIKDCIELAPLHNPANILGIEATKALMPNTPMVGVFDTAFHATMPQKAYFYGVPYELYEKYSVRRYGFHGTSHNYVANRAAKLMGKDIKDLKIVTLHLGNGCSITAVDGGKSVDTSLGFGTISGPIMGTRCGDLDPVVVPFIMEKENLSPKEMNDLLHKQSGLLGISCVSNDMRDIEEEAEKGNQRAKTALEIFAYNCRKYIGAYAAAMGGLDAVVFTAGIGENAIGMREAIGSNFEFLGFKIDKNKNNIRGKEAEISTDDSKVKVFVIPTNEELMIAKDTKEIVDKL